MNTPWLESCNGPVSQQTQALHVCPNIHIPLTAQCSHTHSNMACILQEITTKESSFIKLIHFHGMQLTSSEQVLNAYTALNISTPMSRVLLEKLTVAQAKICMI
jgi:hypothetical protein